MAIVLLELLIFVVWPLPDSSTLASRPAFSSVTSCMPLCDLVVVLPDDLDGLVRTL